LTRQTGIGFWLSEVPDAKLKRLTARLLRNQYQGIQSRKGAKMDSALVNQALTGIV
jgi:hypothetical protein